MKELKLLKTNRCLAFALLMVLGTLSSCLAPPAEQEIRTVLSTFMDQVRQRASDLGPVNTISKKYGVALVPYFEEYVEDSDDQVRWHAYASMIQLGLDANDIPSRQAIVYKLLVRLRDDEATGNKQFLGSRLLQFSAADFSYRAKVLLSELLSKALADGEMNGYVAGYIMLLVGAADMKSELPRLKEFIDEREDRLKQDHKEYVEKLRERLEKLPKKFHTRFEGPLKKQYWQGTLLWYSLRARARMCVKEDIKQCIELVESHPDEGYRVSRLLRDLSYVRQNEVVDYLYDYLKSDKLVPYKGRDAVVQSYASRAAAALSEMLRGFPSERGRGAGQETIERCRKWMAEQKEWDIIR